MEAEKALRVIVQGLSPAHPDRAFLLGQLRELEVRAQLPYLEFDKFPKTEAEVQAELARQADRYIKFGLHKHTEVKMAKRKFKDSFVALAHSQPERFADRFDIPVVVLGQVPAKDVYEAAGVSYLLGGLDVRDWPDDPRGWRTPSVSYLTWIQDGAWNLNKKVQDVRASLEVDTRGATESDGSGLYVAHQRILEHHFIDLPGTVVGSHRAPYLYLFSGRPFVNDHWVAHAAPRFGSALCGRD